MQKKVLITGGTGSLGHALTQKFLSGGDKVSIFSRDEKKQYDMKKIFPDCTFILGDIRDYQAVRDAVGRTNIVIHAASLKYVNISEIQPSEYISTNVVGTQNLINAVIDDGFVSRCVGISTDKACLPINTYGMTKALLEKLFIEAGNRQGMRRSQFNGETYSHDTIFTVARYGNVIGTRGSVVPYWKERKDAGLSLPITNPNMTRFFFSLDDAVNLIEYCLTMSRQNQIVSKKMKSVTLEALAKVMKGDCDIEIVGERPGEKHNEMLLSADELRKTYESDGYFIYSPNAKDSGMLAEYPQGFTSHVAERMTREELELVLKDYL